MLRSKWRLYSKKIKCNYHKKNTEFYDNKQNETNITDVMKLVQNVRGRTALINLLCFVILL